MCMGIRVGFLLLLDVVAVASVVVGIVVNCNCSLFVCLTILALQMLNFFQDEKLPIALHDKNISFYGSKSQNVPMYINLFIYEVIYLMT